MKYSRSPSWQAEELEFNLKFGGLWEQVLGIKPLILKLDSCSNAHLREGRGDDRQIRMRKSQALFIFLFKNQFVHSAGILKCTSYQSFCTLPQRHILMFMTQMFKKIRNVRFKLVALCSHSSRSFPSSVSL